MLRTTGLMPIIEGCRELAIRLFYKVKARHPSLYPEHRLHDPRVQTLALGKNKFLFTQSTVFSYSSINRHCVFPTAKSKLHTDALGGMIQDGF